LGCLTQPMNRYKLINLPPQLKGKHYLLGLVYEYHPKTKEMRYNGKRAYTEVSDNDIKRYFERVL
jgi:hypothetical protein